MLIKAVWAASKSRFHEEELNTISADDINFIIVKHTDCTLALKDYKIGLEPGEVVLSPKGNSFVLPKKFQKRLKVVAVKATQFTFKNGEAGTVHKLQGKTKDIICVDLKGMSKTLLYVALSRCKTMHGVHLSGPLPLDIAKSALYKGNIDYAKFQRLVLSEKQNKAFINFPGYVAVKVGWDGLTVTTSKWGLPIPTELDLTCGSHYTWFVLQLLRTKLLGFRRPKWHGLVEEATKDLKLKNGSAAKKAFAGKTFSELSTFFHDFLKNLKISLPLDKQRFSVTDEFIEDLVEKMKKEFRKSPTVIDDIVERTWTLNRGQASTSRSSPAKGEKRKEEEVAGKKNKKSKKSNGGEASTSSPAKGEKRKVVAGKKKKPRRSHQRQK